MIKSVKHLIFLLFFLVCQNALTQEAALQGDQLSLPVVAVGSELYSVVLTVDGSVSPPELVLTSAEAIDAGNNVATFSDLTLTIPSLFVEGVDYNISLSLISEQPVRFRLSSSSINNGEAELRQQALSIFDLSLASSVVQGSCITCHIEGGVAANSNLVFQTQSASSTSANFSAFEALLNSRADGREHILSRVSGTDHPGGNQLPVGSADYLALESMLLLLEGTSTSNPGTSSVQFFSLVSNKDNAETLRKAAILLTGRLPSDAEFASVADGTDASLRSTLLGLMQGSAFHDFLLEGANDQLLIRGIRDSDLILEGCEVCFPAFTNLYADLLLSEGLVDGGPGEQADRFARAIDRGLIESPLELIAYIVENDRPYTEVLTADYMMFNPALNSAMEGTATFQNVNDNTEFQPGQIAGAYVPTEEMEFEELDTVQFFRITNRGTGQYDFPHAGILNSIGFLKRYPSTATNRNRARARWTFFHFLGIDIERSAPRTTDPVALADTNNPTLLNPNCTVCHATLDPVAGAFQNYNDHGFYRSEGLDSLDAFYKEPEDGSISPYIFGDTWYRDMREPGIFSAIAPDTSNSAQWLASQITADPAFSTATVQFWWPAVFGTDVLVAPEVATDGNYQAKLDAFEAQSQSIQHLAASFADGGFNLKSLLVEMIMSSWFRVESIDDTQVSSSVVAAHTEASFGSEKLLTPEQLQAKTHALTGFNWNAFRDSYSGQVVTGLGDIYRLFYGGINSTSITERAREMTPLMSTVAMSHALESACPIVLKEFLLPSNQRLLFEDLESSVTPENGEAQIRAKLVQLHERLLGKSYATDSQEIEDAYQLFVSSRQERIAANPNDGGFLFTENEYCEYYRDEGFFEGTDIESTAYLTYTEDGETVEEFDFEVINNFLGAHFEDPNHTKQPWVTVITYLMTHYHYLYE